MSMIYSSILWDDEDDPRGNVQHVAEHDLTMDDVEESWPIRKAGARATPRVSQPFGGTSSTDVSSSWSLKKLSRTRFVSSPPMKCRNPNSERKGSVNMRKTTLKRAFS